MLSALENFIWGQVLIAGLIGLGLWFTFSSRLVQLRYFGRMFRLLGRGMHHEEGHLSSFQALVLSVGGRVGAGNIAGVAVAITLGGPGAIFWMWVIGIMGMATSIFECTLAQLYKQAEPDGTYRGGPAYYMVRGLRQPWMAALFSILLLVAFGFSFNALQSHVVANSMAASFDVPTWITGTLMVAVLGVIIFGGVRRIAEVAEVIVPIMALGYLGIALLVIGLNLSEVPGVLLYIIKSAFGLEEAIGGGIGAAILHGVRRGLFSNEAGLGSAPNVAAVAYVKHPVDQGLVQSMSVFIDTIVLCTCTAVIILLSSQYQPGAEGINGIALTQSALGEHVGGWASGFISIALLLFSFSSIMYNYYLGENSLNYFSEENQTLFNIFRVTVLGLVLWGTLQDLSTVFAFADLVMGLLAVVNLVGLALLYKTVLRLLRDYEQQLEAGDVPRFDPEQFSDLDIDPEAWK